MFVKSLVFKLIFYIASVQSVPEDLFLTTTQCGVRGAHDNGFRIINGTLASQGEFPWIISLQVKDGDQYSHICGGAILSQLWIVTAAHCIRNVNQTSLSITAGDHYLQRFEGREQTRKVIKIFTKNFDITTFSNDIALLKLNAPFDFKKGNAMPICLPKNFQEFQGNALVAGWGRSNAAQRTTQLLHFIELPLIGKYACDYNYIRKGFSRLLNNCQICAGLPEGGKDACQGDSGGPLICQENEKYVLCGIVSWGIGCARAEYPGLYTKVSCFVEWIRNTILLDE
ncbi:hypothetical protein WA026_000812 [Henosepilachna vigintioctopunctata]|uniref:Phenoloxidase-activating factor 2 n=1 Tax=Henosepilachna vigintioctopunctata TaxID=420089 RepID=A0AAW1V8N2_9CUCU